MPEESFLALVAVCFCFTVCFSILVEMRRKCKCYSYWVTSSVVTGTVVTSSERFYSSSCLSFRGIGSEQSILEQDTENVVRGGQDVCSYHTVHVALVYGPPVTY